MQIRTDMAVEMPGKSTESEMKALQTKTEWKSLESRSYRKGLLIF